MSDKEKADIIETICKLQEAEKNFVLGYAMGVTAKANEKADAKPKESKTA